jgi:hypothetical protein
MNQQAIPLYITQPIYHDVCIGPVTETVDGRTFKLLSESFDWGSLSPLGAVVKIDVEGSEWAVRCAFFDRNLHSRMPLVPTPARFKLQASRRGNQWHSSRMFTPLTGSHCELRPNTEGIRHA